MQRPRQVAQQKTNGNQVEKYPEGSRDSIVRYSALAVHVANGNFNDRGPMPGGQRRDEPVQFAVKRYLLQDFAPVSLKGRSEIVNVHAAQLGHQPVRAARGNPSQPQVVDPLLPPAADDVISFGNLFQEDGNVRRVMLQVAIHGDDVLAPGMVEPRRQTGGLTEVSPQLDHRHPAVHRGNFPQHLEGAVARAVVHQHDFESLPAHLHDGFEAVIEVGYVFLLVVQRNYDGILGHEGLLYRRIWLLLRHLRTGLFQNQNSNPKRLPFYGLDGYNHSAVA